MTVIDEILDQEEQLVKAKRALDPALVYLGVGPQFDSLRGDPRFSERLKQISLPTVR